MSRRPTDPTSPAASRPAIHLGTSAGRAAGSSTGERPGDSSGAHNHMQIQTTRFGVVTVDPDHLITFPRGIVGLPDCVRFTLLQRGEKGPYYWLQSTDRPEVAFLVVDPGEFFKDYNVSIRE